MSIIKRSLVIVMTLALLLVQSAALVTPAYAATTVRVYAKSVEEDRFVTLAGTKLAVNTRYDVYLTKYGKIPASAYLVGYVKTDSSGAFTKTFRIPSKLVDVAKIGIQLSNSHGVAASNWFINANSEGNTGGEGAPKFSISLVSVKENDSVRIKAINLPANVTFDVRMGKAGTQGVNGIKVGTLRDDDGGSLRVTFDIPDSLEGKSKIDIRVENKALGIVSYLTFENE
jgi:hypothetical protein